MSLAAIIIILLLILVILYFVYEPFTNYVKSMWKDTKSIVDKNKKEQEKLDQEQKKKLEKIKEKEDKLADIKKEQSIKLQEEEFLAEYKKIEEEIERVKTKIKLKQVESIEDLAYQIEADIVALELSLKKEEETKQQCPNHYNVYTKLVTLSSGNECKSTCKDFDPKTLQEIESKDGICQLGNSCYYEHHKWSDLHQACIQDYKLHVKTNKGECKMILDDIYYHITTSGIQIPIYIHKGGKYSDDQSEWGFYYLIEPITTNTITNELCLKKKEGVEIRKKTNTILNGVIMMSNQDWYQSTHIEWTIQH